MLGFKLFKQLGQVTKPSLFNYTGLVANNTANFSSFFKDQDRQELNTYNLELNHDWKYKLLRDTWKKALEKKHKRQARIAQIKAEEPEIVPDVQKLVIHNPNKGVTLPQPEDGIFAVIQIGGSQFKDDVVVAEWLPDYDINEQIVFDKVLLIGTGDYTSLGRPHVETARVFATVEEQCLTEKVIVFKKKRRKNYKRTNGSRQHVTVLRIDKIEHTIGEETSSKAVSLI